MHPKTVIDCLTSKRFVEVYLLDDEQVLFEGEMLDGGSVLPEFQMLVSAIFEDTPAK